VTLVFKPRLRAFFPHSLLGFLMAPSASAVWEYITKETTGSVGNAKGQCKCCGRTQTTSPAVWWTHLKDSCNGSKDSELLEHAQTAADKHFATEAKKKSSSRPMKQTSVLKLNAVQLHAQADEAIARWAFATGQSLRAVDDFVFRDALQKVAAAGPDRKQLGRKRLKEQMIPAEKKRLKKTQKAAANLHKELFGQALVSDGWTDANRRPLLNVLLVSPAGDLFMEAIDTSGNTKDMKYIAEQVSKYIDQDVDLVVMDGACSGAIELLKEEFPWLSGVVCTTHSLDLLMEDLGTMAFAAEPLQQAKRLVKFINNHHKTRALFAELSDVVLLSPASTRFGYNFIMVERLLRCEESVRKLIGSRAYQDWYKAQKTEIKNEAK
jgi:Protein of unknown function (DUF 659)